jgi:hypothetical protein
MTDPTTCRHDVLAAGFDSSLVAHVICASCDTEINEQMRSGKVYVYHKKENVFVRDYHPTETPEHKCSPPRGWGRPGDILTCQICKAEYQYIKPFGMYPGWQQTKRAG